MKTAISIPDDVFERAERLARRLNKSRSELYREAVAEYVSRHDADEVTAALDRVAESVGPEDRTFGTRAARRILESDEW